MKTRKHDHFFWWVGGCLVLALLLTFCKPAHASTAVLYAEVVDGLRKTCFYRHWSGTITTQTDAWRLCPPTIEVEHE